MSWLRSDHSGGLGAGPRQLEAPLPLFGQDHGRASGRPSRPCRSLAGTPVTTRARARPGHPDGSPVQSRRAERQRHLAEPDLDFRTFCRTKQMPGSTLQQNPDNVVQRGTRSRGHRAACCRPATSGGTGRARRRPTTASVITGFSAQECGVGRGQAAEHEQGRRVRATEPIARGLPGRTNREGTAWQDERGDRQGTAGDH